MTERDTLLAEEVRAELGPGERLLWSGRAKTGIAFKTSDWFAIPFSIVWSGFSFFWFAVGLIEGQFFVVLGIPFVIMGSYMLVGRFLIEAKQRSRTVYGVTNQRVIIIAGLTSRSTKSINLRTLNDVTLRVKADGSEGQDLTLLQGVRSIGGENFNVSL